MTGNNPRKNIKIKGLVTPADWDGDGNITAVVISTAHEEEYLVQADTVGEELLGLIGQEVVVEGTVGSDRQGYPTITVSHYGLLADEADNEDEEPQGWELEDDSGVNEDEEEFEYHEERW